MSQGMEVLILMDYKEVFKKLVFFHQLMNVIFSLTDMIIQEIEDFNSMNLVKLFLLMMHIIVHKYKEGRLIIPPEDYEEMIASNQTLLLSISQCGELTLDVKMLQRP